MYNQLKTRGYVVTPMVNPAMLQEIRNELKATTNKFQEYKKLSDNGGNMNHRFIFYVLTLGLKCVFKVYISFDRILVIY